MSVKTKIPKSLLSSKYRRDMWTNSKRMIEKIDKTLPISSAYVMGSFIAKKKRPSDVDFIIMLKTKEKKKTKWSVDMVVVPDNEYGATVLDDARKWVKQKYGSKNSTFIKLK